MIRIGIDGRVLHGNLTGIGRYVFELCKEIDSLLPEACFFVYSNRSVTMPVNSTRWVLRLDNSPISRCLKHVPWLKFRCGKLCKDDNLDFFWATATILPTLSVNVKSIVTVHDLNYKIVPKTMATVQFIAHKLYFLRDVRKADVILTNSQGTANRLKMFAGRDTNYVLYPGADPKFHPRPQEEVDMILNRCRIKIPYILAVATKEPRKNLELLVDVFSSLFKEGHLPGYTLVLAGTSGGRRSKNLGRKLQTLNIFVRDLGYVCDDDLPVLYSGAEIFVFPSVYEGFGMPVLEARKCGARVVTSDIPELREAGDEETVYVKPTFDGVREGILRALASKKTFAANVLPHSWKESAELFVEAIRKKLKI